MQTQDVEISGTAEVEYTPAGMEIGWSDSQIWVKYDGEVSTLTLNEVGYVESGNDSVNVAKGHSADLMDLARGAYDVHYDLMRAWRQDRDDEEE